MNTWLYDGNELAIYLLMIFLIVVGEEFGAALARRQRDRLPDDADRFLSSLATPSIGILALLIGFTFSMALSRFEARRLAVVSEANAIGTAALRGQTLPEPYRSAVAPLFKEYAEIRVTRPLTTHESSAVVQAIRRSIEIQETLWRNAADAAAANPQVVPSGLFMQALNTMIDVHAERLSAARNQVPTVVFLMLEGVAMFAFGFEGYGLQLANFRNRRAMWLMAVMVGSAIMLILDLDRPQSGFITIDQAPLLDFLAGTR
jgi:hypothetical protein